MRRLWPHFKQSTRASATRSFRAVLVCLMTLSVGVGWASTVNEPMTGSTAPGWVIGGSAYLTAGSGGDADGDGWRRLSEPNNDQAGYAYLNTPFDISQGGIIQFDWATWGGTGADGYSIFLFDGSSSFSVGASGGS